MNSNINNSIFEAYINSKNPIVENKQNSQQVIEEAAKPDFLDLDHDGNKTESMKKAAADAKKGGKGGKGHKKGMSAKQAKFFGKKKKKAVKESVNLNGDQKVLKENFRAILQKNGLSDLVTPKILKAMLEAFALGKTVNESKKNYRAEIKSEYDAIKKQIARMKEENKEHLIKQSLVRRMKELKDKLGSSVGYMDQGD